MTPKRERLVQIRLNEEEIKILDNLTRRFGQSRSALLRHALLDFAEKQDQKNNAAR
jgi:predicted transcriptional regulator